MRPLFFPKEIRAMFVYVRNGRSVFYTLEGAMADYINYGNWIALVEGEDTPFGVCVWKGTQYDENGDGNMVPIGTVYIYREEVRN